MHNRSQAGLARRLLRRAVLEGERTMSTEEIEHLMQRWATDPDFRDAVRRDPASAISDAGFQLDEVEWAAIDQTDWTLPTTALRDRTAQVSASPPA